MPQVLGIGWFLLLAALVNTDAQKTAQTAVKSQCLGNLLRVQVAPLEGKTLEVAAVVENSSVPLTLRLASQCGFSVRAHGLDGAEIYASILNCFARSADNVAFTTTLQLQLLGINGGSYWVNKTCLHTAWASREIVCERNYMEVSVTREAVDLKSPPDAEFQMTTVTFFTPAGLVPLTMAQVQMRGYGIANTDSRLVLRGPRASAEMYSQNVAGVDMDVLRTSTEFRNSWESIEFGAVAACPALGEGVSFSQNTIQWALPWPIDPLIPSKKFELLEVRLTVDGKQLGPREMAARQFSWSGNGTHVILEIPLGAIGGHYKSHVEGGRYFVSYTIEPMLELLWTEGSIQTRYTVLFPITTPKIPQTPQVVHDAVPQQKRFQFSLGPFATDVVLLNISFPSEVLPVSKWISRGFKIIEQMSPNSNSKFFLLEIPFKDPVVQQMSKTSGKTIYSLHITFVLMVMPELALFSLSGHLQTTGGVSPVPPSISVDCDDQSFQVLVRYGNQGQTFQTLVGGQTLTAELARQYGLRQNATHFSLTVLYSSPNVVFEGVQGSILKTRLKVALTDLVSRKRIQETSMTCDHSVILTECYPNGTITAWALKLESVPSLNPSKLVLNDHRCGPVYSDNRSAYFVFAANSCGTTRKFLKNKMVYENEISLPDDDEEEFNQKMLGEEPEYEMTVTCYYEVNQSAGFNVRPRRSQPYADEARGELQIQVTLASAVSRRLKYPSLNFSHHSVVPYPSSRIDDYCLANGATTGTLLQDASYSTFYKTEDYPLSKYLQEPLYFEVQLTGSKDPDVSVELEDCWATLGSNRTSQPRWNLIIDGCVNPVDPNQVIFHPVWVDGRVQYPSHFKRFEVQMFAFSKDGTNLKENIFVHCDVVLCDLKKQEPGACNRRCQSWGNNLKGQRRSAIEKITDVMGGSSGPIRLS